MNLGERVSTPEDFDRITVYRREDETGPVYTIVFKNLEFVTWNWGMVFFTISLFVLAMPVTFFLIDFGNLVGIPWYIPVIVVLVYLVVLYNKVKNPRRIDRFIEMDIGHDWLRIGRGNKVEKEFRHSRMQNLTVEEHPEAEFARQDRAMRGKKGISDFEKQHCLIGWFGAGGAEKNVLLCRGEFPNHNSLSEVREAMRWAWGHYEQGAAAERSADMKPPLD